MNKINYVIGDATNPIGDGNKIICHICNDKKKWGAGFVLAISKKWKDPELVYNAINDDDCELGYVQFIKVEDNITIANMIAQHDTGFSPKGKPPIRYGAVRVCLAKVNDVAYHTNSTIHMPRIGCGLAGGDWNKIEKIIFDTITVPVFVYDLK